MHYNLEAQQDALPKMLKYKNGGRSPCTDVQHSTRMHAYIHTHVDTPQKRAFLCLYKQVTLTYIQQLTLKHLSCSNKATWRKICSVSSMRVFKCISR